MVKIFLFFLEFGLGYLRVWPKPCLVAVRLSSPKSGRLYLVEEKFRRRLR
jgi:hypothetical protein